MKIAQVVCAYPPYAGGIGQSAKRFGDILNMEHKVTTFTLKPYNLVTKNSAETKYLNPFLRYGHGGLPFSLLFTLRKFDCIYLHYPFFGAAEVVWLFLLFHPKKKLIIHYHMDTADLAWFLKPLAWPSTLIKNSLFKRAKTITAGSLDYISNGQISEFAKKHPKKFQEVPFGLDTDLYSPKMPHDTKGLIAKTKEIVNFVTKNFIKRGQVNLLFVGGLDSAHYFKGLVVLFEALTKLEYKYWRLNIVGTGNLMEFYQQQASDLGISKKIKFLGRLEEADLVRTYQTSDIFILPSINRHEAFGLVLTEAMACGVPVIASDLPGVRKVFRDGLDGLLAETGNAQDLAEKIAKLIGDEPKRSSMSKSARAYAVSRYSLEEVSDKLKKAFL
jgi:glycosyltransferase involved in cell wall biosynthesis